MKCKNKRNVKWNRNVSKNKVKEKKRQEIHN